MASLESFKGLSYLSDQDKVVCIVVLVVSAKLRIWQVPACKMEPRRGNIATLGSILDYQLSRESCKFQLARWSHEVIL